VTDSHETGARIIWAGRLQIMAAALLWSTSGFFAKAPSVEEWPGPVLAFWRAVFASVLLVPQVRNPRWSWGLVPLVVALCRDEFHVSHRHGDL
jgi:drug/metabolite transporter, DME family